MAETNRILGQTKPAAATRTAIYTTPASTAGVISTLMACNTTASADVVQITVAPSGAAHATSQFIYFDVSIPANNTLAVTCGLTLAATDVVRVYSTGGNIAFTAFGVEIT